MKKMTLKAVGLAGGMIFGTATAAICGNKFEKLAPKVFDKSVKGIKNLKWFKK